MTKTYSGLPHLNGNLLAAIDLETTGRKPGYHEIIQIAIVPLNSDIRPIEGITPFYQRIRPQHPERAEPTAMRVHGIPMDELLLHAPEPDRVYDVLCEWFAALDLPFGKNLVPLAHNWAFESSYLKSWLGVDETDRLFHSHARDAMLYASSLNDKAAFEGETPPFNRIGLTSMCRVLGVTNQKPHDAYFDCLAEAEVYRALMIMNL